MIIYPQNCPLEKSQSGFTPSALHVFEEWYCLRVGFPSGSAVENLPAMKETWVTWVQSLDWEDSLEKGMVSHSNILAWRIPQTEEPGGLQSMGLQRVGHNSVTNFHIAFTLY